MEMSQLILFFQVVAAADFTPAAGVKKGAKDFLREEWVERAHVLVLVVLVVLVEVVVVVRIGMEGAKVEEVVVVEGIPGGAVETMKMIPVEEGEVLIILEKISKMIAAII